MAKLFQFSAFIGKLATLLLRLFLHFDYFIIMSWLLFPWAHPGCSSIPFRLCLIPLSYSQSQSLSVYLLLCTIWISLWVCVCLYQCVCIRFSQFQIFLLHSKLFLVLDKVNFNRTASTTACSLFAWPKTSFSKCYLLSWFCLLLCIAGRY